MNNDILAGKWDQLKGTVQKKWGDLTDDEVNQINGDATKLSGILQERYGKTKEETEEEIEHWVRSGDVW